MTKLPALKNLLTFVLVTVSFYTNAITYTWNGASNNWANPANWSPFGIPTAGDNVRFTGLSVIDPQLPIGGATVTDFTVTTGGLLGGGFNCNGGTLAITGAAQFGSGTFTNGLVICTGSSVDFAGSTFDVPVTANCGEVLLNGSTFNNTASITKTGASNDLGDGDNLFNAVTNISNSGTGILRSGINNDDDFADVTTLVNSSTGSIELGYNTGINQFSDTVYVTNSGAGTISFAASTSGDVLFSDYVLFLNSGGGTISIADASGSNCDFSNNFEVNSTAGGSIAFGASGGSTTLASTKSLSVGSSGLSDGTLSLKGFTQLGTATQTLTLTGTANLQILSGSTFNGDLTGLISGGQTTISGAAFNGNTQITSARLTVRTSNFADTASFVKTSTGSDNSEGGNVFSLPVIFINTAAGDLNIATTNADTYNDSLYISNTDGGTISIGTAATAHTYNKTFMVNSGAGDIHVVTNAGASGTFNTPVTFAQSGTGNIYVATDATSSVSFSEDITFQNTGTGDILFGNFGGTSSLAANKSILLGPSGFTGGILQLYGFTQNGTLTQNIALTSSATLKVGGSSLFEARLNCSSVNGRVHLAATTFQDTVICSAPDILLNNSTYNDFAQFNFNGTGTSTSGGANTFNAYTELNNTTTGSFILGNTNPDIFNDSLLINNTGSGEIIVGHNSAGNTFVQVNAMNQSSGDIYIGNQSSATCTHNEVLYLTNTSSGAIYLHHTTGASSTYNENIEVNSSGSGGVYFGNNGGTGSLIATKTIAPGSSGISAGILSLYNFSQIGGTANSIITSGSGKLTLGTGTVFNAPLTLNIGNTLRIISATFNDDFTADAFRFLSGGATYNGKAVITKNGSTNDYSDGGNTFNDSVEVHMNGTGNLRFASTSGDDYNDFAEFHWTAGTLEPAYTGINTFSSNIWIDGALTMDIPSTIRLDGNNQTITMTGVDSAYIETLDMSTATGTVTTIGHIILPNATSTINLGPVVLDLNGYELRIHNDNSSAISRTTGYILTEQTDNSSKISWDIGNNTDAFVYPIGNSNGTYIPFTIQVTSGNLGTFSVATYGTGSNNLPLPTSPDLVGHLYHWSYGTGQSENSISTVDRYWQLDKTGTSVTTNIIFTYDELELAAPNSISEGNLRAQRWNSFTSDWDDGIGAPNTATNTVTANNVSNFSPWTLVDNNSPLPVEWLSFQVSKKNNNVSIDWSAITDSDSKLFTIERSKNMEELYELGMVDGGELYNQINNYHFEDNKPESGINYYRIKQTNYNGTQSYTEWKSINISSASDLIVYSSKGEFIVSNLSGTELASEIRIVGLDGKIVSQERALLATGHKAYRKMVSGPHQILLYEIILIDNSEVITGKVMN